MKIVVTGSTGHISKPLTQQLLHEGHEVTVITSNPKKQQEIEYLGAEAAIGSIKDVAFLTTAFKGADVVYCMKPPQQYVDHQLGFNEFYRIICENYVQAIRNAGVSQVVHLSSIGAHTDKGVGILSFHYQAEEIFNTLSPEVAITHVRPVGFYYNLLDFIDLINGKGILGILLALRFYGILGLIAGKRGVIVSNYGGNDKTPWVSPLDIAQAIAKELTKKKKGISNLYIASDELTCNEVAKILGDAIGKPYLKWGIISGKQLQKGMQSAGVPGDIAAGVVEMYEAHHTGKLFEHYNLNRPQLGHNKLKDYANEFAAAYHSNV